MTTPESIAMSEHHDDRDGLDRFKLAQMLQEALFAHPQAGTIPVHASLLTLVMEELRTTRSENVSIGSPAGEPVVGGGTGRPVIPSPDRHTDKESSATPRTDAVAAHLNLSNGGMRTTARNLLNLARQLERELAEAQRDFKRALANHVADLSVAPSAGVSIRRYYMRGDGQARANAFEHPEGEWVRYEDVVAHSAREEICHNPQGSHGRWSATERHCYSCGVTVKHGEELICRYPPYWEKKDA